MSKIPTAEEFHIKNSGIYHNNHGASRVKLVKFNTLEQLMIEFAKLHVTAALEAAAIFFEKQEGTTYGLDTKETQEEVYPLNEIK